MEQNDNKEANYRLIRYDDVWGLSVKKYGNVNMPFIEQMKKCSEIYSAVSEHQGYLLIDDFGKCIGGIYVGSSCDEKDLEVEMDLDCDHFSGDNKMYSLIDDITSTLKLLYCGKQNVVINLHNKFDLAQFNSLYKKEVCSENLTEFRTENEFYCLMPTKFKEYVPMLEFMGFLFFGKLLSLPILNAEKRERILYELDALDSINVSDDATVNLYDLPISTSVNLGYSGWVYLWRCRRLFRDGYHLMYNVFDESFDAKGLGFHEKYAIKHHNNKSVVNIKDNQLTIMFDDDKKREKVIFRSPIENNSCVDATILFNKEGFVRRCAIDFRTLKKSTGKTNGTYMLRFDIENRSFSAKFVNRSGSIYNLMRWFPLDVDDPEFWRMSEGIFDLCDVDEVVKRTFPYMKKFAESTGRPVIEYSDKWSMEKLNDIQNKAVDFVHGFSGVLALPHLTRSVDDFIEKMDTRDVDAKVLEKKSEE